MVSSSSSTGVSVRLPDGGLTADAQAAQGLPGSRSVRMRQGTKDSGRVPEQAVAECQLLTLPETLWGKVWPAERVVVGQRVCKQLRTDLTAQCSSISLVQKAGTMLSESCVLEDLRRLPAHLRVTLRLIGKRGVRCTMTCAYKTRLLKVLVECKALAHLNLRSNGIGDEGAGRLAGALGGCKALAHLDLHNNQIGAEGAVRLAGALGECKALAHLDFRNNRIGAEGAVRLAGALGECKALAHLDLSRNLVGDEGAGRLAGALGGCKALAQLNLSRNGIGAEGAGRLAEALGECKALAHLDLSRNGIGDEGAGRLAGALGALGVCKALAHLDLSWNRLGAEGAVRLAGALGGARRWLISI